MDPIIFATLMSSSILAFVLIVATTMRRGVNPLLCVLPLWLCGESTRRRVIASVFATIYSKRGQEKSVR